MPAQFGVVGLGEWRSLAGTTSRSLSTTYVHSHNIGRKPAALELPYLQVNLYTNTKAAHGTVAVLLARGDGAASASEARARP